VQSKQYIETKEYIWELQRYIWEFWRCS